MLIFAGLGNPGDKYHHNRHNIGFLAMDVLAEKYATSPWKSKFNGLVADAEIGGEKVLLIKPQTFMNNSGECLRPAAQFYKVAPEDIVVFYDELDLAAGKIRAKIGGGAAGHNGIRSSAAHLGENFWRVRIGIGHPGEKDRVHGYVLSDFSKADMEWVKPLCSSIVTHAPLFAQKNFSAAMSKIAHDTAPVVNKDTQQNKESNKEIKG